LAILGLKISLKKSILFSMKKFFTYMAVLAIIGGTFALNTTQASAFDLFSFFHWYSSPEQQDQKEITTLISHGNSIAEQLSNRINSLEDIASTLSDQMNQTAAQGIDVSDAWINYNQATSTIAKARSALADAKTILDNANQVMASGSDSSDQDYTNTLTSLNNWLTQSLQDTEDAIKDTHQSLLTMTLNLQNDLANPTLVAQETPTQETPITSAANPTATDTMLNSDATSTLDQNQYIVNATSTATSSNNNPSTKDEFNPTQSQ
jgi:ElaB/YqjD/DUF883 family membrane-anchored ribosome-binding protein